MTNKTVKKEKKVKGEKVVAKSVYGNILLGARITEKATASSMRGVYIFNVSDNTNKKEVEKAVKAAFGVEARMVRIAKVPSKTKRNARTGKYITKSGAKKAYVYLKKGDSINI